MGSNTGAAALIIVGVVLVFLGIFAGGNLPVIVIGVVALIAAGTLQAAVARRR